MASFGDELRREREVRGISLRDVAESTKISLRFLEALEANDFNSLPEGVFTRGFIRAYAQQIGADPERLVNAYLFEVGSQAERRVAEPGRVAGPRRQPAPPARSGARRWIPLALAAMLTLPLLLLLPASGLVNFPPQEPTVPPSSTGRVVAGRPADPGGALEVLALEGVHVRVRCSGERLLDRRLEAGERWQGTCPDRASLEADLPGAVRGWQGGREIAIAPAGESTPGATGNGS